MTSLCGPHHTERFSYEIALKLYTQTNGSSTSNTSIYPNNILVTRDEVPNRKTIFMHTHVICKDAYNGPCPRYCLCMQCVSVHDEQETNDQVLVVEECVM